MMRTVAAAAVLGATMVEGQQAVIETIDMFRSLNLTGPVGQLESLVADNLADILGTLRYIQQEIIIEHVQDKNRLGRKYGINTIMRYRMKVKNPASLVSTMAAQPVPWWGLYGAFDYGVNSDNNMLSATEQYGDYVGIESQNMNQWIVNTTHPRYWYSVSGPCPNLPWKCVLGPSVGPSVCTDSQPPTVPAPCVTNGCYGKESITAQTCPNNPSYDDPTDTSLSWECCLRYHGTETIVTGGLCANGTDPTGQQGCVYNYRPAVAQDALSLDELTGIADEECTNPAGGTMKCGNWFNFRNLCTNPAYKKKWLQQPDGSYQIVTTNRCTEYDINPICQQGNFCAEPACMALNPDEREFGLPFWKGKCDNIANTRRGQKIAKFFFGDDVVSRNLMLDPALVNGSAGNVPCTNSPFCLPGATLSPLCTRSMSGVCTVCYIPFVRGLGGEVGLDLTLYQSGQQIICPWNIMQEPTIAQTVQAQQPSCMDMEHQSYCCLYGISPQFTCADPAVGPGQNLTIGNYLYAASRMSDQAMYKFALRWIAQEGGYVKDGLNETFKQEMHWQWDSLPPLYANLTWMNFQSSVRNSPSVGFGPKPTTTAGPGPPPGPGTTVGPGGNPGGNSPVVWIIGGVVAGVLVLAGVVVYCQRQKQARERLLTNEHQMSLQHA